MIVFQYKSFSLLFVTYRSYTIIVIKHEAVPHDDSALHLTIVHNHNLTISHRHHQQRPSNSNEETQRRIGSELNKYNGANYDRAYNEKLIQTKVVIII